VFFCSPCILIGSRSQYFFLGHTNLTLLNTAEYLSLANVTRMVSYCIWIMFLTLAYTLTVAALSNLYGKCSHVMHHPCWKY